MLSVSYDRKSQRDIACRTSPWQISSKNEKLQVVWGVSSKLSLDRSPKCVRNRSNSITKSGNSVMNLNIILHQKEKAGCLYESHNLLIDSLGCSFKKSQFMFCVQLQ